MTSAVKKLGCSNLKTLLEDDKLITNDYDIISELTTFVQKRQSFEELRKDVMMTWQCVLLYSPG